MSISFCVTVKLKSAIQHLLMMLILDAGTSRPHRRTGQQVPSQEAFATHVNESLSMRSDTAGRFGFLQRSNVIIVSYSGFGYRLIHATRMVCQSTLCKAPHKAGFAKVMVETFSRGSAAPGKIVQRLCRIPRQMAMVQRNFGIVATSASESVLGPVAVLLLPPLLPCGVQQTP